MEKVLTAVMRFIKFLKIFFKWSLTSTILSFVCGISFAVSFKAEAVEYYQIECKIYDSKRTLIKDFGGAYCQFSEDGSFVMASYGRELTRFSSIGSKVWTKNLLVHHQLNLTEDEKEVLALSHEYVYEKFGWARYDVLLRLNLKTGKILAKLSLKTIMQKVFQSYPRALAPAMVEDFDLKGKPINLLEFTHWNSINEIPENSLGDRNPIFRKGNIIVSGLRNGSIFVFDRNLTKIVWHWEISKDKRSSNIHDATVTKDGKVLFYANEGLCKGAETISSINTLDPITNEVQCLYPKEGQKYFFVNSAGKRVEWALEYSSALGGVQLLGDGSILTNSRSMSVGGEGFLVGAGGEIKWVLQNSQIDDGTKKPRYFQKIFQKDLSKFLSKNRM